MKFDPFLSDEPSIAPPTPGAVLVRLSQVIGTLHSEALHSEALHSEALHSEALHSEALHSEALHSEALHSEALHSEALHSEALFSVESCDSIPSAKTMPSISEKLASARARLVEAIECGQLLGSPFQEAQNALRLLYSQIAQNHADENQNAVQLLRFGFPDPRLVASERVLPIAVSSVVATHFKPERQIFTTLSFDESHGATAYWLLEVRYFGEERLVDGVVENYAPQFSRVRLPVGKHHFIIESRNAHYAARSEEFELEVPMI